MEFNKSHINDLLLVIEKDNKFPVLVERIKAIANTDKKFEQVNGLEKLIEDCKSKDVPSDKPSLLLIKHIYRQYTS